MPRFWFQCRTRLCGWCSKLQNIQQGMTVSFNAARGFVGGAAQMFFLFHQIMLGFNAARGFVGGAAASIDKHFSYSSVSMPHAALWVVQRSTVT